MTNGQAYQTRLVTGKVRLSFVHLFRPYKNPRNTRPDVGPRYSVTILLPKSDTATFQRLQFAINEAIRQGVAEKWGGQKPPIINLCVHDGDGAKPSDGTEFGPECKGHWVFTASCDPEKGFKPEVVDATGNPVMNESEMYSGVYARVSVNFFPYDNTGKKGIGCGLGNVQKLEDGEPLGNRTSAASDFGQPMAGAPMAGQPGGFTVSPNSGYISPAPPVQPSPAYPVGGVVPGQFNQPVQPGQPAYNAGQFVNPVQPVQPAQPVQVNPITGQPITPGGGILGL